ncbi:hypothetical protein DM194_22040 (plasmid) [Azospirillum ramasamyi]|uniref:Uncharacterized protein n=1 Tax=Azospirillum ramasamyi TaxID=682998 RepID=A0A2U9SBW0_9PROT|nr:hypothetical protein DM194_22040 [Azospirillum ramasamyi]
MPETALVFWMFDIPARCRDAGGRRLGEARALLLSQPQRRQRMMLELSHASPLGAGSRIVTKRAAFVVEHCEGESGFGFRRYAVRCTGTRPAP